MKKENKAILEMLLCATLWSIAGIFMKLIPWNGLAVAGLRSLIAGLTIGVYMLIKRIPLRVDGRILLAGVLAGCVYLLFACANKLTTAANAIVLQFTSPVFIVLFSALLYKTPIRKADLAVVFCTLAGIALFFFDQLSAGYVFGNLVAIAAGMFMAGMYMAIGGLEEEKRFSAALIGQGVAALVGMPFLLLSHPVYSATALGSIFVLGVFQLGLAYILYVRASRYCPPLACCLLGAVEPLLNPVWVLLFDGERPGPFALIGGLIVISAVTLWCMFGQQNSTEQEPNHA